MQECMKCMKCMKYIIKPATPTNIPDILRIQELCYGADLCESYEVFFQIISNPANLTFSNKNLI